MTDLAAPATGPVRQAVVHHDPAADPDPDGDQREITASRRRAEPVLGSRQRPHIVLENRWQAGAFANHSNNGTSDQSRNDDTCTTSERGDTGPARLTPTA